MITRPAQHGARPRSRCSLQKGVSGSVTSSEEQLPRCSPCVPGPFSPSYGPPRRPLPPALPLLTSLPFSSGPDVGSAFPRGPQRPRQHPTAALRGAGEVGWFRGRPVRRLPSRAWLSLAWEGEPRSLTPYPPRATCPVRPWPSSAPRLCGVWLRGREGGGCPC